MSGEAEFIKQLQGSGAANGLTLALLFCFWVAKNKCKHWRCVGHSFCSDCSVREDDEEEPDLERGEGSRTLPAEIEEKVLELLQSKYPGILQKRAAPLEIG